VSQDSDYKFLCEHTEATATCMFYINRPLVTSFTEAVTLDLQGHKPSNHICARIKSRIYTIKLSRYHNTYRNKSV
jgi:hypothetical protein